MKNIKWIYPLIVIGFVIALTSSCNKEDDTNPIETVTGTVTDIEGNIYNTVKIGKQWWMVENLKTTKYNDGTTIPSETDDEIWYSLSTPGYCWYDNNASYKDEYGALYNDYAVDTGKLCPIGWHVPTVSEWEELFTFLGGKDVAGLKLLEKGTTHWIAPNDEATNESGFTALPGGFRMLGYAYIGNRGYWWVKSESGSYKVLLLPGGYIDGIFFSAKYMGYSVRCIKD